MMNSLNQQNYPVGASVPCTCGELFQGTLDGEPCLVSCPINIFSKGSISFDQAGFSPLFSSKVQKALHRLTQHKMDFTITVDNPLPVGRGFGTSTADIGAALFTASHALQIQLTAQQAAGIALQVEPTDSTFFQGLNLLDHREGKFQQYLGEAIPAQLIILDPGGMVDTEAYNQRDLRGALSAMQADHLQAFNLLQYGINHADLFALAEAATLSAKVHQTILYNPLIEIALPFVSQLGAAGICRAHSGTVVGLLLPDKADIKSAVRFLKTRIPGTVQIRCAALIGGGVTYSDYAEMQLLEEIK